MSPKPPAPASASANGAALDVAAIEARLLNLGDDLLARARRGGAAEAEVFAESVTQVSANVEQNVLKGASASEHEAVGLRVFVEKQGGLAVGFAYVNRLDGPSLDEAVADAIAIARASPADPANGLAPPTPTRVVPGLFDPRVATLGADDVTRSAKRLLDLACKRDKRISIDNGSFGTTAGVSALRSSTGVAVAGAESAVSWGLFGMAVDGADVGSFDSDYDAVRSLDDVNIEASADRFCERVLSYLGPRTGKNKKGAVLFSSEAFEEIYLDALLSSVDGDTVLRGKSRLKEKLGERVAAPGFTVIDDGTLPGGLGSSAFDREGRAHRRTPLVGDGVLHSFLYDVKTARRANRRPTGHAQGSARNLPGIGTTNITVARGALSEDALLRELGEGLYVGRFSGNVDAVSGDFSGVAKGSFWVSRGQKRYPVKETLIAGNAFDGMLHIAGVGDTHHKNMSTLCPWVLVDGIDVTVGA